MTRIDRAGELIEGVRRERKELVSPEGVPLAIQIAGHDERLAAFFLDMAFMGAAIISLCVLFLLFLFLYLRGIFTDIFTGPCGAILSAVSSSAASALTKPPRRIKGNCCDDMTNNRRY